jgi:processive 1,2-diacylglycerol beta-glucosyltransferase
VAGRDKELNDALAASDLKKDLQIKIFGFVNNMEELMTAADLIFSKAGGLTVSECLAKGLPMVINKVIPGQEEDNLDYLVKNEAAIRATTFDEIIEQVNRLLGDPQKIASMKGNCLKLGRPHSAEALADFVYNKINEKK